MDPAVQCAMDLDYELFMYISLCYMELDYIYGLFMYISYCVQLYFVLCATLFLREHILRFIGGGKKFRQCMLQPM